MMIGAMKKISVSVSIILGTILGPVILFFRRMVSTFGLIAGSVPGFLFGEIMISSQVINLYHCNFISSFISRFMGAITEKVSVKSKIFKWFNFVTYSTLAALIGRMIIFPAGVLAESEVITNNRVYYLYCFVYN